MKEDFDKAKEVGLFDDCVKIAEKDLGSDDCEIETRISLPIFKSR